MADNPSSFNPYQPTDDPLGSPAALDDPRLVAADVAQVARWQTFVAVFVSLSAAVFIVSMLVRTIKSGDPASYFVESLLCPLAMTVIILVVPAIELWKSVGAARQCGNSESGANFGDFAARQRSLWRTLAIVAMLLFALFAMVFLVSVVSDVVRVNVGN